MLVPTRYGYGCWLRVLLLAERINFGILKLYLTPNQNSKSIMYKTLNRRGTYNNYADMLIDVHCSYNVNQHSLLMLMYSNSLPNRYSLQQYGQQLLSSIFYFYFF